MSKESVLSLDYQKITSYKQILRALRTCKGLNASQRFELRDVIDQMEDLTLGADTKLKNLRESYSEQKGHKAFVEDAEKAKLLISNYHDDVDKVIKTFGKKEIKCKLIKIDESIFEPKEGDSQEEINDKLINRNGFLELEGLILMSSADDGGEPKKPGGR